MRNYTSDLSLVGMIWVWVPVKWIVLLSIPSSYAMGWFGTEWYFPQLTVLSMCLPMNNDMVTVTVAMIYWTFSTRKDFFSYKLTRSIHAWLTFVVYLHQMTPLHLAAESGHIKIVNYLCDEGADINVQDIDGVNLNACRLADLVSISSFSGKCSIAVWK